MFIGCYYLGLGLGKLKCWRLHTDSFGDVGGGGSWTQAAHGRSGGGGLLNVGGSYQWFWRHWPNSSPFLTSFNIYMGGFLSLTFFFLLFRILDQHLNSSSRIVERFNKVHKLCSFLKIPGSAPFVGSVPKCIGFLLGPCLSCHQIP